MTTALVPRPRLALLLAAAFVLAGAAGCTSYSASKSADQSAQSQSGGSSSQSSAETTPSTSQEAQVYTPAYKPNGSEVAVIKTDKGTIRVKFYSKDAPIAVANFIELAQKGFYNGIKFHRYVPGFVIQGGDPQTKSASSADVAAADTNQTGRFGTGGPGYTIADEYANNPNKHVDGTLAMARTQAPDSAGSQFYFALAPLPQLDNQYTVFGQADAASLAVIHKLRAGDTIESVTIENATK